MSDDQHQEPPEVPQEERWITTPQMLILVCLAGVIMWAYAVKWIMAWLS